MRVLSETGTVPCDWSPETGAVPCDWSPGQMRIRTNR